MYLPKLLDNKSDYFCGSLKLKFLALYLFIVFIFSQWDEGILSWIFWGKSDFLIRFLWRKQVQLNRWRLPSHPETAFVLFAYASWFILYQSCCVYMYCNGRNLYYSIVISDNRINSRNHNCLIPCLNSTESREEIAVSKLPLPVWNRSPGQTTKDSLELQRPLIAYEIQNFEFLAFKLETFNFLAILALKLIGTTIPPFLSCEITVFSLWR